MTFECKKSTKILSVGIKCSMRDQICHVIHYCSSRFAMGKIKCTGWPKEATAKLSKNCVKSY